MPKASTRRGDFSADERVEIRDFFGALRHRRWLWKQSSIWIKWTGSIGVASLAAAHWANDFIPVASRLLRLFGLGGTP